jgi:hypothetical protein
MLPFLLIDRKPELTDDELSVLRESNNPMAQYFGLALALCSTSTRLSNETVSRHRGSMQELLSSNKLLREWDPLPWKENKNE